jgi:hypothetical protein
VLTFVAEGGIEVESTGRGEDLGDDGAALRLVFAAEAVVDVQVERRGAPEGAPAAGEGLCAGGVLGGDWGGER